MSENKERMFFFPGVRGDLFIHEHNAGTTPAGVFLFLNPFFDEKKRAQHFLAQTARGICNEGYSVFRFDYYGTGDSKGKPFELLEDDMLLDLSLLDQYIRLQYPKAQINVVGIRLGADIALKWAATANDVLNLLLIEPVFYGNMYLVEQRTRRRIFHKINGMSAVDYVTIDNVVYEDFQGYPLSGSALQFITSLDAFSLTLEGKSIFLYKLDNSFSAKYYAAFTEQLSAANNVTQINVPIPTFWDKMEIVDTTHLVQEIVTTVNELYNYVR